MSPFEDSLAPEDQILHFGQAKTISKSLNVLIWNVYKGKKKSFSNDFKVLLSRHDLFLLQEIITSEEMLKLMKSETFVQWHLGHSFIYKNTGIKTGVAVGSRLLVENPQLIRGSERELFMWTPKVSLAVENKLNQLLLVSTHVVNFTTTLRFRYFVDELLNQVIPFSGKILLSGDFNTWNIERWFYLLRRLESAGFQHFQFPNDQRWLKLDHVFYKNIKIESGEILNKVNGSDHWPLSIKIEI